MIELFIVVGVIFGHNFIKVFILFFLVVVTALVLAAHHLTVGVEPCHYFLHVNVHR
jgi:hypothetical protein